MKSILFLVIIFISSCYLQKDEDGPTTSFEVLWESDTVYIDGNYKSVLEDNILYFPQEYSDGIGAINTDTGELLWSRHYLLDPRTEILIYNNYIISTDSDLYDREDNYDEGFLVLDKYTGDSVGFIVPDIIRDNLGQIEVSWISIYKNYLYFSFRNEDSRFKGEGLYRIDLKRLIFSGEERIYPIAEELYFDYIADLNAKPIFENDKIYLYVGAIGARRYSNYPEEDHYLQEDIKLLCLNLDGEMIWETGFEVIGDCRGAPYIMTHNDEYIYISDGAGRTKVRKSNGEVIYEVFDEDVWTKATAVDYLVYDNDILFCDYYKKIKAYNESTGEIIWEYDTGYSNDTNPIVYGDLVYNVDAIALRAFNRETGKLVYEDRAHGIDGMRSAGYIPKRDDVIYIMDTNVIKAVRLKK